MKILNRYNTLTNKIKIYSIITIIFFAIFIPSLISLINHHYTYLKNIKHIKFDISKYNSSLISLKNELQSLQLTKSLSDKILTNNTILTGIQIEKFITIMSNLKNIYMLSDNLNISISPIINYDSINFNNNLLQNTTLTINCETYTDTQFIAFLDALQNNLPGYGNFQYVLMEKTTPLDQTIIDQAINNNKLNYLIKGTIKVKWYDFKSQTQNIPEKNTINSK